MAPCILPEFRFIQSISITGGRYWDFSIDPQNIGVIQGEGFVVFVKRKIGQLSYLEDPHGM